MRETPTSSGGVLGAFPGCMRGKDGNMCSSISGMNENWHEHSSNSHPFQCRAVLSTQAGFPPGKLYEGKQGESHPQFPLFNAVLYLVPLGQRSADCGTPSMAPSPPNWCRGTWHTASRPRRTT